MPRKKTTRKRTAREKAEAHNRAVQPVLDSRRRRRAKAKGTGAGAARTQGVAHSRRKTTADTAATRKIPLIQRGLKGQKPGVDEALAALETLHKTIREMTGAKIPPNQKYLGQKSRKATKKR